MGIVGAQGVVDRIACSSPAGSDAIGVTDSFVVRIVIAVQTASASAACVQIRDYIVCSCLSIHALDFHITAHTDTSKRGQNICRFCKQIIWAFLHTNQEIGILIEHLILTSSTAFVVSFECTCKNLGALLTVPA